MKWDDFNGLHAGETGLIIGNGPSLKNVPLDFLRKFPSFGTNGIYRLQGFTPTYYVAVNPLVIEQFEGIRDVKCQKFLAERYAWELDALPLHSAGIPVFSKTPDEWIYEGHTVTFVALQIAYFMGFSTVLLVGVDHKFTFEGRPNQQLYMAGNDPNHFDTDYFKGKNWNAPDLVRSAQAYRLARAVFEADGKRIINLTQPTEEPIFERGNINDW